MNVAEIFSDGGPIAYAMDGFESRPQQIEMARAIEQAIEAQEHLLVEAGTGTGKSLAYLVPFIMWAVRENKRVMISTYTKALQHQLMTQDLPFLKKSLGIDFRYALCLGTGNFLCPRRLERADDGGLFPIHEGDQLRKIRTWAHRTQTGILSDLNFVPSHEVWSSVNRDPELCNGQECKHYNGCPFYEARKKQFTSQVLVANHHLFFANLSANCKALPPFDAVVFDEGHIMEDVASDFLGISVANSQLDFLFDSLLNARSERGLLTSVAAPREIRLPVETSLAECRSASDLFFGIVQDQLDEETSSWSSRSNSSTTVRIRQPDFVEHLLDEPLGRLSNRLGDLKKTIPDEEQQFELEGHINRCDSFRSYLASIIGQHRPNHVYWVEVQKRSARRTRVTLSATPIDLSDLLREQVFERFRPVVVTSATLTMANSFDYLQSRIGIRDTRLLAVGSPFDFSKQAMIYTPEDIPDPGRDERLFEDATIDRAAKILEITGGGAFVLCTSYRMVERAYTQLERRLADLRFLKQGDQPRERLLSRFKSGDNSVLIATTTFWQGIDVPGDVLRCVILMRLPFAVPDTPIVEARMEHLELNGYDPFRCYQVPQAVIMLRQGFGRLIRAKQDYGLVAILDPRVRTRTYGRIFVDSLPQCKRARNLFDVERFFGERAVDTE